MPKRIKLTKAELMRLRNVGMTTEQIALTMGCSVRTVERRITEFGLAHNKVHIDVKTLLDFRTSEPKMPWKRIAEHFGCSLRKVYLKRREYEKKYAITIP